MVQRASVPIIMVITMAITMAMIMLYSGRLQKVAVITLMLLAYILEKTKRQKNLVLLIMASNTVTLSAAYATMHARW